RALFENFKIGKSPIETQGFFSKLSRQQFEAAITSNPDFHEGDLNNLSLFKLAVRIFDWNKVKKYFKNAPIEFYDSLNSRDLIAMDPIFINKALPENYLNEVTIAPHVDDGQFYLEKHLKAIVNPQADLDLSKVPEA